VPPITVGNPPIGNIDTQKIIDALVKLRGLTREAAEAVAATCARFIGLGLLGGPDLCTGERTPIFLSGGDMMETTEHNLASITSLRGPKPALLRYGTNPYRAGGGKHYWYDLRQFKPNVCENRSPKWCDEYPFWSTVQGGPGAALKPVPGAEQDIQRAALNSLYFGACKVRTGKEFVVIPIPIKGVTSGPVCVP
jgi:hypothetical protein